MVQCWQEQAGVTARAQSLAIDREGVRVEKLG
jgi:hypothetical protein